MLEFYQSISPDEWMLFLVLAIALLSLFISMLAYRRAGRAISTARLPATAILDKANITKPLPARYKSAEVSLRLTAKRDVSNQLRLVLKNNGIVPAREIDLTIGDPIRVINQQDLAKGVSESINFKDVSLQPRLTVIDSANMLPISEVAAGVKVDFLQSLPWVMEKHAIFRYH